MMTVVMGVGALIFIILLVYQQASSEYRHAQRQRRADTVVIGAEAMLERYAAKLTIDPLYYRHYVDEAEITRRCDDPTSSSYGFTADPGINLVKDHGLYHISAGQQTFQAQHETRQLPAGSNLGKWPGRLSRVGGEKELHLVCTGWPELFDPVARPSKTHFNSGAVERECLQFLPHRLLHFLRRFSALCR